MRKKLGAIIFSMCACAAIICMGGCQSSAADNKKLTETQETQENETASGNVAEENMSDEEDTKEEEHLEFLKDDVYVRFHSGTENHMDFAVVEKGGSTTIDIQKLDSVMDKVTDVDFNFNNEAFQVEYSYTKYNDKYYTWARADMYKECDRYGRDYEYDIINSDMGCMLVYGENRTAHGALKSYPLLFNPETGEYTDILKDCKFRDVSIIDYYYITSVCVSEHEIMMTLKEEESEELYYISVNVDTMEIEENPETYLSIHSQLEEPNDGYYNVTNYSDLVK